MLLACVLLISLIDYSTRVEYTGATGSSSCYWLKQLLLACYLIAMKLNEVVSTQHCSTAAQQHLSISASVTHKASTYMVHC
eukprot:12836-Heterococcus_DN1.PRE.5